MVSNQNLTEEELIQDEVLLNGTIKTKGAFTCQIISELTENKLGGEDQTIRIEGVLKTKYYMKELDEIESIRYYINGIFVTREAYDSLDDTISYTFRADYFKPKFQYTDYERK